MAYALAFVGTVTAEPLGARASGEPATVMTRDVRLNLRGAPKTGEVRLTSDAPVSISFDSMAAANAVSLTAVGGKARARLTSTDGSQQAVPVDPSADLFSQTVPFTAIDLTRVPGASEMVVKYVLGEM